MPVTEAPLCNGGGGGEFKGEGRWGYLKGRPHRLAMWSSGPLSRLFYGYFVVLFELWAQSKWESDIFCFSNEDTGKFSPGSGQLALEGCRLMKHRASSTYLPGGLNLFVQQSDLQTELAYVQPFVVL